MLAGHHSKIKQKKTSPFSASAHVPNRVHKISKLDIQGLKVVRHKEVIGILHVLIVVEPKGSCRDGSTGCFMCFQEGHRIK